MLTNNHVWWLKKSRPSNGCNGCSTSPLYNWYPIPRFAYFHPKVDRYYEYWTRPVYITAGFPQLHQQFQSNLSWLHNSKSLVPLRWKTKTFSHLKMEFKHSFDHFSCPISILVKISFIGVRSGWYSSKQHSRQWYVFKYRMASSTVTWTSNPFFQLLNLLTTWLYKCSKPRFSV